MHPLGVLDSGGKPTEVIIDRDTRYGVNAYDYFVEKIGRTPKPTEKVHFIVATDVAVVAAATNVPAIDFDNRWTTNHKVTLTNYGFILGRGGKAGMGGFVGPATIGGNNTGTQQTGFKEVPAKPGGNGGIALRSANTIVKVSNNKVIASGGGGGGGTGAWFIQNVTNNISRNWYKLGAKSPLKEGSGGGSSGSGGAPLGEWVPHNNTPNAARLNYEKGSKNDRLIVGMVNFQTHKKWGTPPNIELDRNMYAYNLSHQIDFELSTHHRLLKKDARFLEDFDQFLIRDVLRRARGSVSLGGDKFRLRLDIKSPHHGWKFTVSGTTVRADFLVNAFDQAIQQEVGSYSDVNRAPKTKTYKILNADKEFFENIRMSRPTFTCGRPNGGHARYKMDGFSVETPNPPCFGSSYRFKFPKQKTADLEYFGLTQYFIPPVHTGYVRGGYTGVSWGEQFTSVEHMSHNSYSRKQQLETISQPYIFHGSYEIMIDTPHVIKSNVLYIDRGDNLIPHLRERDFYYGGRGGGLGDDGESGVLNKLFVISELAPNGQPYNVPTLISNYTKVTPPANGGRAGNIWAGKIEITNMPTGVMRGYRPDGSKVDMALSSSVVNKLESKFVKPVFLIERLNEIFIPGFDPYDWEAEVLNFNFTNDNGINYLSNHARATKKYGVSVAVLTKNLILNATLHGGLAVVIPAGYMSYSHITGMNEFVNRNGDVGKILGMITTYLVETLKVMRDGVFHLVPPFLIDDIIRNIALTVYNFPIQKINELIDLKNRFMSTSLTANMDLTGIPTRVVNGQTQYLIAEYNVHGELHIRNGSVTHRAINSTLISQTSIASSFNLPLFNGHDSNYERRITLPSNIDLELMPRTPGNGDVVHKVNDYTYVVPNSIDGSGDRKVKYWAKSVLPVDKCIVDIEKQKLVRDAIECYRQTGKWE